MCPWIPFIFPTNKNGTSDSGIGGTSSSVSSYGGTKEARKADAMMKWHFNTVFVTLLAALDGNDQWLIGLFKAESSQDCQTWQAVCHCVHCLKSYVISCHQTLPKRERCGNIRRRIMWKRFYTISLCVTPFTSRVKHRYKLQINNTFLKSCPKVLSMTFT